MLDGILEALAAGGFSRADVVFICGYKAEVIRAAYPDLTYVENRGWEQNNILLSLLCAREHLAGGFVSTYGDIVYRPEIVADLVATRMGAGATGGGRSTPRRTRRSCAPRGIGWWRFRGVSRRSRRRGSSSG
jgi:choline kinase